MNKIDNFLEKANKGVLLNQFEVKYIMQLAIEILVKLPNVINIDAGVTIAGDLHGQFYDLKELFQVGGELPHTNYLFLGDYVDRGAHSVEVIVLLTLLKIKYPNKIHLLRGNHESKIITQIECIKKYNTANVWLAITEMFDYLPIAAVIDRRIFCIHGGLSPLIQEIDEINSINRIGDIPTEGPFADLMWSDPEKDVEGFIISLRGAGYVFGERVVDKFLHSNSLDCIVRAHQLCVEGYEILFNGKIITVWSAPNYMNRCFNFASVLEISENLEKNFNIFEDADQKVSNVELKKKAIGLFNEEKDKYFQ